MTQDKYSYFKMHKIGNRYEPGRFVVKGYGDHPKHSVCYPNTRIVFLAAFDTEEAARKAYPQLPHDGTEWGSKFSDRELVTMPQEPPEWFDPAEAGEVWREDDY